ncbi:MAG TPA: hypothetical protein VLE89_01895 [Chlamydiales bacterium]|nr:hypothetical protein [Chlamydiales bacterium]
MTAVTMRQRAFESASSKPLTSSEIYGPMVSTSIAASSLVASILARTLVGFFNPWTIGFAALAALPGSIYGTRVYTDWIPKALWSMPKGEAIRCLTGVPNVKLGLKGWKNNSVHSNHFNENLADALVGLCRHYFRSSSVSVADFECGGRGQYPAVFREAGFQADGFDFSPASVNKYKDLQLATLSELQPAKKYDLVTSFEAISKTLPGEEEVFIKKLIHLTKSGGKIAMSCAIPGQAGPNSNCYTNKEIIAIFERENRCKYNEEATLKLRRLANPMHLWLKSSILVFDKL